MRATALLAAALLGALALATPAEAAARRPPPISVVGGTVRLTSNGTAACTAAWHRVLDVVGELRANTAKAKAASAGSPGLAGLQREQTVLLARLRRAVAAGDRACAAGP